MAIFRALLLCFGLLAGTAWGAEYELSFSQPAKIGALTLSPGRYKVKVQGSVVIFTDMATTKSSTALTRVERTDKPAGATWVQGTSEEGVSRVEQIVLSGADFKLRFAN